MRPDLLYHFTCTDAAPGIDADRALLPNRHVLIAHSLVWLTDLAVPDRAALGLTAEWFTRCDRTAVRIDVAPGPDTVPWTEWARRARLDRYTRALLEAGGAFPRHWWVSSVSVPVLAIRHRGDPAAAA